MSNEGELFKKVLKNLSYEDLIMVGMYGSNILMGIAKTKYKVEKEFDMCVTDLETHKTEPGPLIIPKHAVFIGTEEDCNEFVENTSKNFVKDIMDLEFISINVNKLNNGVSIYYCASACEGKKETTAMVTYTISSMLD